MKAVIGVICLPIRVTLLKNLPTLFSEAQMQFLDLLKLLFMYP